MTSPTENCSQSRPGSRNVKPDVLSRLFDPEPVAKEPEPILPLSCVVGAVIHWAHTSPLFCHPGVRRTMFAISRRFWWPSMEPEVREYVEACSVCARNKSSTGSRMGLLQPLPIPSRPWSEISLDFVTGLPVSQVTRSYLLCIFVGSLSVLIMCGNLLVIISIIYFKQLHTPTNYLILSLAVADLLVGIVVMPFSIILTVTSCWYLEDLLYRYYAVCQPLSYRTKMNVGVIVVMILLSWTVSALLGIGITLQGLNEGQSNRCVLFQHTSSVIKGTFFAFYLPAIIMFSIYLKIFIVAQRQARSIQNTTCQRKSKRERKATKTLAVVIGVFLICWTPFILCITFYPLSNYTIPVPLIETFKWLGWSNSMLNPFVYGFFYSWFRSSLRIIISGKIFQGDFTNSKLF
ncbi:trace amine-associated receptor 1-like [Centropristis striata]|uniref:trace amine-associated receptor 1-like n=1 Tax=Centropristis striata TaxID=184440 RepID=UPI0027E1BE8A|nr:trace amine-associated receptor 1-like [Centropristis striata]